MIAEAKKAELPGGTEEAYRFCQHLIDDASTKIQKAAGQLGLRIPLSTLIGILPTGLVNARVLKADNNEYLIIFDSGFFKFAHAAADIFTASFPLAVDEKGRSYHKYLVKRDELAVDAPYEKFCTLLFSYLTLGNPLFTTRFIPDQENLWTAYIFAESLTLFGVAHEYAHIIMNHLDSHGQARAIGDIQVDEVIPEWECEFEADALGATLMIQAMSTEVNVPHAFGGTELFFCLAAIIEQYIALVKQSETIIPGSHPPPGLRRNTLRSTMQFDSDESRVARKLGTSIEIIGDTLWSRIAPFLTALRQSGYLGLAPWWH